MPLIVGIMGRFSVYFCGKEKKLRNPKIKKISLNQSCERFYVTDRTDTVFFTKKRLSENDFLHFGAKGRLSGLVSDHASCQEFHSLLQPRDREINERLLVFFTVCQQRFRNSLHYHSAVVCLNK